MSFVRVCLSVVSFGLVTGCYGADFTSGAPGYQPIPRAPQSVRIASEHPGPDYVEVGLLSAAGTSFEDALDRMREQAGAQGCDVVFLLGDAIQAGRYGRTNDHLRASCYVARSAATAASGTAPGSIVLAPAPPPAPAAASSRPAPKGAAGFAFGEKLEEAGAACSGAGKEWDAKAPSGRCSGGVQETGLAGPVSVTACGGRLCAIDIDATPPQTESAEWLRIFRALRGSLSEKYGDGTADVEIPAPCEQTVFACLRYGSAHADVAWKLGDVSVRLQMAAMREEGKKPLLHVRYEYSPEVQKAVPNPAAL